MKIHYHSLILAALFAAALLSPTALGDSCTYAGDVNEVRSYNGEKEVIRLGLEYVDCSSSILYNELHLKKSGTDEDRARYNRFLEADRARLPQLREAWKAAILAHPEQVNDLISISHLGDHTPLLLAVQANDYELAKLLLNMGAIPFLTNEDGQDAFLPEVICTPYPGPDEIWYKQAPEISKLIQEARRGYNLHEICLRAQQAGHVLREWTPRREFKPLKADIPAKTGERAYLYADESRNGAWEWALNAASWHFSKHVVAVKVVAQRLEGKPGLAKATVMRCLVEDVINGDTPAGSMVEYHYYPETPVMLEGRRLIICANDIQDGKVVEPDPYVYSRDTHYKAFMQVKGDRENNK